MRLALHALTRTFKLRHMFSEGRAAEPWRLTKLRTQLLQENAARYLDLLRVIMSIG